MSISLSRVARLPPARAAVLLEALLFTGIALLVTWVLPYRWQRRFYGRPVPIPPSGQPPATAAADPGAGDDRAPAAVRWALAAVQRHQPFAGGCLAHALAGRLMLRRRGYPATLYVGAMRTPGGAMRMHAWLLQGRSPITGCREAHAFKVLGVFE